MAPKAKERPKAKAKGKAASRPEAKAKASPAKRAAAADPGTPPAKAARTATRTTPQASPKAARSTGSGGRPVDSLIPGSQDYKIYEDYTAKLNQTNIGHNNNKFYVIQVLTKGDQFYTWNRWGRVGEPGQNKLEPCLNAVSAIASFEKKFREKTSNAWSARDNFTHRDGKYDIVEMEEEEGGGGESAPLGKLSKAQIEKGMGVLSEIETELNGAASKVTLTKLSSTFFTLIPTNFGRKVPDPILKEDQLREKEELLKFWLRMGFEEEKEEDGLTPISGIMKLPVPETLEKACGPVCQKGSIVTSTKKGEELAKKQAGGPVKVMGGHLYASIMLYTSNAIYKQLNKALRETNRGAVKKFFGYLRLLFEAMDTLPKKKTTLWRGLPVDLYDQYSVGSTQTWWNVSSCTADINVAKNFMKGCGGKCTLLTVEAKTACDISQITFYSNEKESLLAPGTQLKVKSAKRAGQLTEITLTEIGRAVQ
mmetsp:Transcript_57273/g.123933  ORF Transcript_57273/g.123933 Transcript_57273/m.123933 type:complete len:480 (-) Transcript_57273:149-1588(-)|eukprot:CAMPEP_0170590946 /NCGR_PEP_ID=MMETSP0224-20130122/12139_1 /TAXON_ID=285029 /ORGANISM="Togula jolla, Strain CCCM 725" /LENGTH=479 /DNA_ID=CAMNT_0010914773 /DNA_START=34 /DNA_END=1473 /DNA_ORIENTATION=-